MGNMNTIKSDSFDLIDFTLKNIKHLCIIATIGAVVSGIVAFSMPPLFKSSTTMFPTILNPVSNHLYVTNPEYSHSAKRFGEEQQVEQLIQILKSNLVIDKANAKFDLVKHFEIDPSRRELYDVYEDYVSIKKTDLSSISVTVLARTPQMSADLANFIASMADTVIKEMTADYSKQNLKAASEACKTWESRVKNMEDSLNRLASDNGLVDIEMQVRELEKAHSEALKSGNATMTSKFEKQLKEMGKKAGQYRSLKFQLEDGSKLLNKFRTTYDAALTDVNADVTSKLVISRATPPVKKAAPKRMIIVLSTAVCSFFFALLVLLILDFFKSRKKQTL